MLPEEEFAVATAAWGAADAIHAAAYKAWGDANDAREAALDVWIAAKFRWRMASGAPMAFSGYAVEEKPE
jgi:hypothetical protein